MASADEYAAWIVQNKDRQGTPEFATVAAAYEQAKQEEAKGAGPSMARQVGRTAGDTDFGRNASAMLNVLQGPSFGFADEALGLAGGVGGLLAGRGFGTGYQEARDVARGALERHQQDYPVPSAIGQLSGGLALGGPVTKLAGAVVRPATSTFGRIGQAAGMGGAFGAVGGAGTAEDVASVPREMARGGLFGTALGLGIQPSTMAIVGAKNFIAPTFSGAAARTAAQARIANSMANDERTAQMALARLNKMGPEARVVDTAGQSTRDLLDTVTIIPGKTRNAAENMIRARTAGRAARLDEAILPLTGGARATPTLEALQQAKEAASRPLYAAVDNMTVPITPELERLMQRPVFQEAFDKAMVAAKNRDQQLPMLEDLLKVAPAAGVKVKFWDSVKKLGFDDLIAAKKRGLDAAEPVNQNKARSDLQAALDTKHALVKEIDNLTRDPKTKISAYEAARDAFAGPAALQTAVEDGMKVWKTPTQELRDMVSKMSASERQAFQIGAGEALRQQAGSPAGQAQLLNAWKDRNLREKLQVIYGTPHEYHKALSIILREERLRRVQAGRGSQTEPRAAAIEDLNLGVITDAAQAASAATKGNFASLLDQARRAAGRMATPAPVRNEIGRILMTGGPQARTEISALDQLMRDIAERNAGQAAFSGLLSGGIPRF